MPWWDDVPLDEDEKQEILNFIQSVYNLDNKMNTYDVSNFINNCGEMRVSEAQNAVRAVLIDLRSLMSNLYGIAYRIEKKIKEEN